MSGIRFTAAGGGQSSLRCWHPVSQLLLPDGENAFHKSPPPPEWAGRGWFSVTMCGKAKVSRDVWGRFLEERLSGETAQTWLKTQQSTGSCAWCRGFSYTYRCKHRDWRQWGTMRGAGSEGRWGKRNVWGGVRVLARGGDRRDRKKCFQYRLPKRRRRHKKKNNISIFKCNQSRYCTGNGEKLPWSLLSTACIYILLFTFLSTCHPRWRNNL